MNACARPSELLRWDLTVTAFVLAFVYAAAAALLYGFFPQRLYLPSVTEMPYHATVALLCLYAVHFLGVKLSVRAMRRHYDPVYRFVMIAYGVGMAAVLLATNIALFFALAPLLLLDLLTVTVVDLV